MYKPPCHSGHSHPGSTCSLSCFLSCWQLQILDVSHTRHALSLLKRQQEQLVSLPLSPYLQLHRDKVTIFPNMSFLSKMVLDFHISNPFVLPTFFCSPISELEKSFHILDVCKAHTFYTSRTKPFPKSNKLFLSYQKRVSKPHPRAY